MATAGIAAAGCLTAGVILHGRLVSRAEDESAAGAAELRGDVSGPGGAEEDVIFVWVSDCSSYQEWQSLALMWSIYKHQGPSTAVTRLISGCTTAEEVERRSEHALAFPAAAQGRPPELFFTAAHVHEEALNDTYPPYNRPHSIAQWVEASSARPGTRVVLLDPDMVMLARLILPRIGASPESVLYRGQAPLEEALRLPAVGQRYRYMAKRWPKAQLRLGEICESWAQGCLSLTAEEVEEHFSVGPPWIIAFRDLRRAAPLWRAYVPRVRKQYRELIAEMYAYVLAFASLGVRHAVLDHFVVSYPNAPPGEHAWQWVEDSAAADAEQCSTIGRSRISSANRLPTFLHYCEIYQVEGWYFRKRHVPHEQILDCSSPLFAEPGPEPLRRRQAEVQRSDSVTDWDRQAVRQAWFLCALLSALNEAVGGVRAGLCPGGRFNETRSLRVPYPKGDFYEALQAFFKDTS